MGGERKEIEVKNEERMEPIDVKSMKRRRGEKNEERANSFCTFTPLPCSFPTLTQGGYEYLAERKHMHISFWFLTFPKNNTDKLDLIMLNKSCCRFFLPIQ